MHSEEPGSIRTRNWVSKSDLLSYLRCPYSFYLFDSGQVTFIETVNASEQWRIGEGIRIHEEVTSQAPPRFIEPSELPKVFAEESIKLLNVPVYENAELEIYGQPDGIDTSYGALIPMEIKSRINAKRTDKLELAFYWLLLEPFRTRAIQPIGHLQLRGIGTYRDLDIPITFRLMEEVHELLAELRHVRVNGAQPTKYCTCHICGGVKREEMLRSTHESQDVSLIRGIGAVFGRALTKIGVSSYQSLLSTNTDELVEQLRGHGCRVSASQVNAWKQHAESYASSSPIVFGNIPSLDESFIALDLEYDQGRLIWIMGICVVDEGHSQYFTLWAESFEEEFKNLRQLFAIIALNSRLPVITWNGRSADLPQLKHAAERHALSQYIEAIQSKHQDLYQSLCKAVRFPIPQLGLHEIANYYQLPQSSHVRDGMQALFLFQEYLASQDNSQKEELKRNMLEYSRKDLEALVGIVNRIRGMQDVKLQIHTQ